MPNCPKCNIPLDWDDTINTELTDTDEMISTCQGTCPQCGGLFLWDDVYVLDRVENVRQITIDSDEY